MSAIGAAPEYDSAPADSALSAAGDLGRVDRDSGRQLARVASGGLLLNVFNTGATVLGTALLARVMDLAAFGVYSWVVATVALLTVPAILGVDRLLVRDTAVYLARGAYGHVRGLLKRSAQLVTISCLLIAAGGVAIALLAGRAASQGTVLALAIGIIALPMLAYGRVAQSALMGIQRIVLAQVPDLLVRPAALLLMAFVAFAAGTRLDGAQAVLLFTVSCALSAVLVVAFARRGVRASVPAAQPEFDTRRWLLAAFALALVSGGQLVNSQLGTVMLGLLDKPEAAGLYAVAQRGALLIAFPLMAVGAALAPTAARLWAAGQITQLQRLVTLGGRGILLAAVPIALAFILFGDDLLRLVFGASFSAAGGALVVLSLGQLVNAATGSVATLLVMSGNTWRAGAGMAAGILLNLVLAVLLIPTLHSVGAAAAASVGLGVSNLILVVITRRRLGIDSTALGLPARQR